MRVRSTRSRPRDAWLAAFAAASATGVLLGCGPDASAPAGTAPPMGPPVFRTLEHPGYVGKLPNFDGLVGLDSLPRADGANPVGTVSHVTVRGAPAGDVTVFLDGEAPLAGFPTFGLASIGDFAPLTFRGRPTAGMAGDWFSLGEITGSASVEGLEQTLAFTLGGCFDGTGCAPASTPRDLELDLAFAGRTLARGIDPATVPGLDLGDEEDEYLMDLVARAPGLWTAIQLLRAGPVVLDATNARGAFAPSWIGGTVRATLGLVSHDPLNVGASFVAESDYPHDSLLDLTNGHVLPAGLPFGSPFVPVGLASYGYGSWGGAEGRDFRAEPGAMRIDFPDGDVDAVAERVNGPRRVDPASGRPVRGDAPPGAACTTGAEPHCWTPGDPLTQNGPLFDALCAWSQGLGAPGGDGCGLHVFNETTLLDGFSMSEVLGAILTGDRDGALLASLLLLVLTGDYLDGRDIPLVDLGAVDRTGDGIADDPPNDPGQGYPFPRLARHLSPEQQALLGCGAFVGQPGALACDELGVDLRLAEASALTSAWLAAPGFDPASGVGPMPGTAPFVALHGRTGCARDTAGGAVVLPGCRAPGDPGWSAAADGDPAGLGVHPDLVEGGSHDCPLGGRGWCTPGHPYTGEPWATVMDAVSWNLQVLLALLSAASPSSAVDTDGDGLAELGAGDLEPLYDPYRTDKCSVRRPDLCARVDRLWSLTVGHHPADPRGAPLRRWVWESGALYRVTSATGPWARYAGGLLHAAGPDGATRAMPLLLLADADGDGVADATDDCTNVADPDQRDADGDGFGDRCDCDFDFDGACNVDDFTVFLADLVAGASADGATDMNGDATVNVDDFSLFLPGFLAGEPGPAGFTGHVRRRHGIPPDGLGLGGP